MDAVCAVRVKDAPATLSIVGHDNHVVDASRAFQLDPADGVGCAGVPFELLFRGQVRLEAKDAVVSWDWECPREKLATKRSLGLQAQE